MRESYPLTDATRKVLNGTVQDIADEMDVSDKYIYSIQAGNECDPFGKFRRMYAAAVRAQAPVCHWDQELATIRARYERQAPNTNAIECLTKKIHTDASTTEKMVKALKDGEIDAREAEQILTAVSAERKVLDLIEAMLQFKVILPNDIREKARARRG